MVGRPLYTIYKWKLKLNYVLLFRFNAIVVIIIL